MSLLQGEITMSETFTIVRKGDTFQGIALEHSTTVSALKKMNHIYGNNTLFVGQKLRIKEDPPSSLLAEASRSNKNVLSTNMKKGSSGSINRKSIQKPLPPPSTNTSSIYDFITSSLWGVGLSKSTSMSTSTSNNSTTIAQPIDDGKNMKGSIPDIDTLSAGFRPRASSGVGMEDLDSGEVIVTMPLTKSGDFKKAQPQADEVVVEPFVKAKIRNEHIKNAVLQQDNNNNKTTFLSINGQKLIDTEFDAELVEVNDHYFLSKTEARGSSSGGGSGSGSGSGHASLSKPRGHERGAGGVGRARSRTKSVVKVELLGDGRILSQSQAQVLAAHLPAILQANKWTLLYSVLNNGADLFSFYKLTKGNRFS
jgi:LysM repeat protein